MKFYAQLCIPVTIDVQRKSRMALCLPFCMVQCLCVEKIVGVGMGIVVSRSHVANS